MDSRIPNNSKAIEDQSNTEEEKKRQAALFFAKILKTANVMRSIQADKKEWEKSKSDIKKLLKMDVGETKEALGTEKFKKAVDKLNSIDSLLKIQKDYVKVTTSKAVENNYISPEFSEWMMNTVEGDIPSEKELTERISTETVRFLVPENERAAFQEDFIQRMESERIKLSVGLNSNENAILGVFKEMATGIKEAVEQIKEIIENLKIKLEKSFEKLENIEEKEKGEKVSKEVEGEESINSEYNKEQKAEETQDWETMLKEEEEVKTKTKEETKEEHAEEPTKTKEEKHPVYGEEGNNQEEDYYPDNDADLWPTVEDDPMLGEELDLGGELNLTGIDQKGFKI